MLTNNTILITGGSSGIGLELAKILIQKNNRVLICSRSEQKLAKARQLFPEAATFTCDVSSETDCLKLREWVAINHPTCNILINNTAIVHQTDFLSDNQAIEKAQLEFQTNILAPIRLSKLFLPILLHNPDAQIINITSGLVYAPRIVYPFYNATKAALHSFTQTLRLQLRESPIKITEVMLPVVDTPWHKGNAPKSAIPANKAVEEIVSKLTKDNQSEIRIGKVSILYWLSRIAPTLATRIVNLADK